MRVAKTCVLIFVMSGLLACASGQLDLGPPAGPNWPPYQAEAIRVRVQTDPELNMYDNKPHTIVLCIYQMRDPNAFNQLRQEEGGLYTLLECKRFDPSVTLTRKVVDLQPDSTAEFILDRAEGTRYVGMVAGYFNMIPENMTTLYRIPVSRQEVGTFSKTVVYTAEPLDASIYLGPSRLRQVEE